jgi:hypothetical protein
MVTLNKPAAGDTNWYQPITDNWTNIQNAITHTAQRIPFSDGSTLIDSNNLRWDNSTNSLVILGNSTGGILPLSDTSISIGTSSLRVLAISSVAYNCFLIPGDAQPTSKVHTFGFSLGPGGSTSPDINFQRTASAVLTLATTSTLPFALAGQQMFVLTPVVNSFSCTHYSFIELDTPTGSSTITDAPVFYFNNVPGTHKSLAANAAVAVTLGAGPTGSTAGNPQGWMRISVNGTVRFIPFW